MLPTYVKDTKEILPALRRGDNLCVIEESTEYPGELSFFAPEQEAFVRKYSDFISTFSLLSELFMYGNLIDQLEKDGCQAYILPTAVPIIQKYQQWARPLHVTGLDLGPGKKLFPFQQFAIRRAMDSRNTRLAKDGFFFNFGTGTGKSVIAAAGAQELFNNNRIDLVICYTLRKNKINLARTIQEVTQLKSEVIDGTKERRAKRLSETDANVICLNYEKSHFDYDELANLIVGRRVLFVCDEVQLVLHGDNPKNRARKGTEKLFKMANLAIVWSMSASIVKSNPLRYHDVYDFQSNKNPLRTRSDFIDRYCDDISTHVLRNGVKIKHYKWNVHELVEVRHRVSGQTMAVRKTDPGVREFFKGMTTQAVYVQQSPEEKRLANLIRTWAKEDTEGSVAQYYNCLRYIANTPAALRYSEFEVAQRVVHEFPKLVDTPSSKFEMICDKFEQIREQGDQVVAFTQWTYLTLFLLAKELKRRGIPYVTHYGTGMTDREAQEAQDRFKSDPDKTVFLSSDAGAYGLNFQNARYVVNIETPYDPDKLMQRNDRIDRADSHLDGLTAYVYIVEGSVEEDVWAINEARRAVSAATQGTIENLSRFSPEELAMTESQAMRRLMRGGLAPR